MCAIFVIVGKSYPDLLKKISMTQVFRGPDAQGFYSSKEESFCFGNNRLEVIDKHGGKQPMFSEDKNVIVVFNGAIYNFEEIKKYLQNNNIKFETNSDTEVIANAYMYWGDKMFNYLDGMWALSIYDKKKNEIILSRDYVGQKPLFYFEKEHNIYFSSQLKGFSVLNNCDFEIKKSSLKKFFAFSYLPAPDTLYKNIYQVKPGENIYISLKSFKIKKKQYWNLEDGPDYNIFFKKTSIDDFKSIFKNTVKQHTIADKSPAVLLSGGLDSYLIANELNNQFSKLKSFSLGFHDSSFDESKFIKKLDLKFEQKIFLSNSKDFLDSFKKISSLIDEPMGDSSLLPSFIIFNKIKEHTNVAIGGDGGDESFFGYITFDAFYFSLMIKKIIPKFVFNLISKVCNFLPNSKNYMSLSFKIKKFFSQISHEKKYLNSFWLSSVDLNDLDNYFNEKTNVHEVFEEPSKLFEKSMSDMRLCQLYYFKFYLPMVLSKVDKASMYNSVECRSPYLSKKIINFSLDVDVNKNFKFLRSKYLLKKIFSESIPSILKNKNKHGFALPLSEFINLYDDWEKYIEKKYLFNESFFLKKLGLAKKGDFNAQKYIWNEIVLNLSIQNIKPVKA